MELTQWNKQAIKYLKESEWWKILCDELRERIADIQEALETPWAFDSYWDDIKQLNAIRNKQNEITYLKQIIALPDDMLSQEIVPIDNY